MQRMHKGKYVKKIKKATKRSAGILQITHTDICGPFSIKSVDGYDSFITFTDDYSRYDYIYPIKKRSEALDKFKVFKAEVENMGSTTVDTPHMAKFLKLLQGSYRKIAWLPSTLHQMSLSRIE